MDFSLKLVLFVVQCQKLHFSFTYQTYLSRIQSMIKDHLQSKDDDVTDFLQKTFGNKQTFTYNILRPVSNFSFSAVGMTFCLTNPSFPMFLSLPFLLIGFFISRGMGRFEHFNRVFTKVFLSLVTLLILFNEIIALYMRLRISEKSRISTKGL